MIETDIVFAVNTENFKLEVESASIYDLLGYENIEPDDFTRQTISESISRCLEVCQPAASMIIKNISSLKEDEGIISIEDSSFHIKKIISRQLKGAQSLAFFICTIGKAPELLSKKLFEKGDSLEGYIISLAASEAADSLAAYLHDYIGKLAITYDLGITNRFSPGYCSWDVAEQKKVFEFFPNNSSGISLNESALMNPIKSVSGIVGIGKNLSVQKYPCSACPNEKCLYR